MSRNVCIPPLLRRAVNHHLPALCSVRDRCFHSELWRQLINLNIEIESVKKTEQPLVLVGSIFWLQMASLWTPFLCWGRLPDLKHLSLTLHGVTIVYMYIHIFKNHTKKNNINSSTIWRSKKEEDNTLCLLVKHLIYSSVNELRPRL